MKHTLILSVILCANSAYAQLTGWQTVTGFGSNPGALNMYSYAPSALPANAPLVVVMHGCTQTAADIAAQSGWNKLAAQHGFYVVYPEQIAANNSSLCFNWFDATDQSKNQGEALSIKQMIDHMKTTYTIDSTRIFVTGLSAGACMTNVIMGCYPQLINKGAVMSGTAYKSASSALTASSALSGLIVKTPLQWGDFVRNENPGYTGKYPKVAVFQGVSDFVVNYNNVTEIVKQWTNVHATDQTADATATSFAGNNAVTQKQYYNANNEPVVETYMITGFWHAIALDTGNCFMQCGKTGTYAADINFSSTYWAAYFFDIITFPSSISGLSAVATNQANVTYTVNPINATSSYFWEVPTGATIPSGQNSNPSVTIDFGTQSGYVQLLEIDANNCLIGPYKLWVNVGNVTDISTTQSKNNTLFFDATQSTLSITNLDISTPTYISIVSLDGKVLLNQQLSSTIINLPNTIAQGTYIVRVQNKHSTTTQKINTIY